MTFASCTPIATSGDAGREEDGGDARADAGFDAGYDAGLADGDRDAGIRDGGVADAGSADASSLDSGPPDSGCPCFRADAGCPVPPDFPPDASAILVQEQCACQPNALFFCYDETDLRCASWVCRPGKAPDGGARYFADGGLVCFC